MEAIGDFDHRDSEGFSRRLGRQRPRTSSGWADGATQWRYSGLTTIPKTRPAAPSIWHLLNNAKAIALNALFVRSHFTLGGAVRRPTK